jgi:endonuclease III
VKNASECAKNLTELLKTLPEGEPPAFAHADDPVAVLVLSSLMWGSSTDKALAAYERLFESVIDFNELRVCMPHETAGYLGTRYPRAMERSERLRATLRNIFLRDHAVTLDPLHEATKREVKRYLESLEGMVPYVASRVMLLCFDVHTIPVDELLCEQLIAAGAVDESATVNEISSWLSRRIKAREDRQMHFALQAWIDRVGGRASSRSRRRRGSSGKLRRKRSEADTSAHAGAADSAT